MKETTATNFSPFISIQTFIIKYQLYYSQLFPTDQGVKLYQSSMSLINQLFLGSINFIVHTLLCLLDISSYTTLPLATKVAFFPKPNQTINCAQLN